MLCSVVIPLYNKAPFIEEAIASVLAQQYQNFEIIIVDDGSRDDGPNRVRAMRDTRICLVEMYPNAGVSCARNRGIALANGELVCFLDADDWYHPVYLQTIMEMAQRFPDVSYFAAGYRRVRTQDGMDLSPMSDAPVEYIADSFAHRRRFGAVFCTNSVAVRRNLLDTLQPCFPPGESMGEDLDLWFRLGQQSPLVFSQAQLAAYRLGLQESLTATHVVRDLLPSWARLEERALSGQMPDALRTSALQLVAHERIMLARAALSEGRRADAFLQLRKAWRGIGLPSWWVTATLIAGGPTSVMRRWSRWREERAGEA